eukprot:COSAG01_NODE_1849_length_9064_cov_212.400446_3_plen_410_part_00
MSVRYIDLLPSNISSTDSAGYSKGTPLIQFSIGSQETFLIGSTVRLNGTIRREGTNANKSMIEPSLGVYNILDQLVVSSNRTNQTIEHIRNYNRFLASYLPATSSEDDLIGHMGMSALTTLSFQKQNNTQSVDFSIPLPCGVLLGRNPIPLSNSWGLGGMNLTIHLSPDSNVFFNNGSGGEDVSGVTYTLTNLSLTGEVSVPAPDQLSRLMNQSVNSFEYNSISSYYAVISNSHATINLNLGLKRVLAVFANFISASNINNYSANSLETLNLRESGGGNANITEVVFTRGGVRFPLDYDIATIQRDYASNDSGDGQLMRNYLNSIRPFSKLDRTLVSNLNTTQLSANSQPHYGIGIAYDTISNQGVDFSSEQFSMVIKSTLSNNNIASFIFAHSKQTVLMSPQGLQVLN